MISLSASISPWEFYPSSSTGPNRPSPFRFGAIRSCPLRKVAFILSIRRGHEKAKNSALR